MSTTRLQWTQWNECAISYQKHWGCEARAMATTPQTQLRPETPHFALSSFCGGAVTVEMSLTTKKYKIANSWGLGNCVGYNMHVQHLTHYSV